jgi:hypothetical protein
MSTFRVKLTQGDSRTGGGNLDENAQTNTYSIQRTMYAMGPNKINRKLKDGDTFTDCNYWKRFAYPTVAYNEAFIEVVTDDGSPYIDGQESLFTVTYSKSILAATTYTTTNNIIDILTDYGGPAEWASITVTGHDVAVRINGSSTSTFTVSAGTSHTFNRGDALINKITIDNSTSGATTATVVVQVGVLSKCNS